MIVSVCCGTRRVVWW